MDRNNLIAHLMVLAAFIGLCINGIRQREKIDDLRVKNAALRSAIDELTAENEERIANWKRPREANGKFKKKS